MKTLDAHGDDYRNAQLNILLEVTIRWTRLTVIFSYDAKNVVVSALLMKIINKQVNYYLCHHIRSIQ